MTFDDRVSLILRRLDEIERKLDDGVRERFQIHQRYTPRPRMTLISRKMMAMTRRM